MEVDDIIIKEILRMHNIAICHPYPNFIHIKDEFL